MSLALSTVEVWVDDVRAGSGLVLAPDRIVTCAHVLERPNGEPAPANAVTVRFLGASYPVTRVVSPAPPSPPAAAPSPDVAVLVCAARLAEAVVVQWPIQALGVGDEVEIHGARQPNALDGQLGGEALASRIVLYDSTRGLFLLQEGVVKGFSGGPVFLKQPTSAVAVLAGMIVERLTGHAPRTWCLPSGALLTILEAMGEAPAPREPPATHAVCPFPGLQYLDEARAPYFAGRDIELASCAEKLAKAHVRWLHVDGASGAGKSSLLRAGLVPHLRLHGLGGRKPAVVVFRPSDAPLRALVKAWAQATGVPEPTFSEDSTAWLKDQTLGPRLDAVPVLVVIDQLEEAFAPSVSAADRSAFGDTLAMLVARGGVYLLTTMRGEFTDRLGELGAELSRVLNTQSERLLLGPMSKSGYAVTLSRHAALAGLTWEPGLESILVAQATAEPGALPLVAHVLEELWTSARATGRLTTAAYELLHTDADATPDDMPPLVKVLRRAADAVYDGLPPGEQAAMRAVLMGLVRPGRGTSDTRRVLSWSEACRLAAASGLDDTKAKGLIEHLSGRPRSGVGSEKPRVRMLTISRVSAEDGSASEDRVDVIHELLLRRWPRCQLWIEEERRALELRDEVERAAETWAGHERHDEYLPRGALLKHQSGELLESDEQRLRYQRMLSVLAQAYLEAARELAETQRTRAEAAVRSGLNLAQLIGDEVARGLADRAGTATLRNRLLNASAELIQTLMTATADTTELRRVDAVRLMARGDLARTHEDTAGARRFYEEALKLRRMLSSLDPRNMQWQWDVSVSLNKLGDLSMSEGNTAEARRNNEEALKLRRTLSSLEPANMEWQRDVSVSLSQLGDLSMSAGDTAGARQSYEEALKIGRTLSSSDTANTQWLRDVSVSLNKLGVLSMSEGDTAGARRFYEEALKIGHALSSSDPGNVQWQRDLSVSLNMLGDLSMSERDTAGARGCYEEALKIRRTLSSSDIGNMEWQRDLSASLNKLGDLSMSAGDMAGARRAYDEALTIGRTLSASDAGNMEWQRDVSVSVNKLGDLLMSAGDTAGARQAYDEALKIGRTLSSSDPANMAWQRDVSVSLNKLGGLSRLEGDAGGARRAYEESLSIRRKLSSSDPGNMAWRRDVSLSLSQLGDLLRSEGDTTGARGCYEEALKTRRTLSSLDPENMAWRWGVSVSLSQLGDLSRSEGNTAEARRAYRDSLKIGRALSLSNPRNMAWQRDLSVCLSRLGDLSRSEGDAAAARRFYEEALGIRRTVSSADPGNMARQRDVSALLNKLGDLSRSAGDTAGARRRYEEALKIGRTLSSSDPGNRLWQRDVSGLLKKLGELSRSARDTAGARQSYEEVLKIQRTLLSLDPGNTEWQREVSASLSQLGDLSKLARDTAGARRSYDEALKIRRALSSSDPGNREWQRDVSVSLSRLGELSRSEGDKAEARRYHNEALKIRRSLSSLEPENMEWRFDVAISHYQLLRLAPKAANAPHHRTAIRDILDTLAKQKALTDDPRVVRLRKAIVQ